MRTPRFVPMIIDAGTPLLDQVAAEPRLELVWRTTSSGGHQFTNQQLFVGIRRTEAFSVGCQSVSADSTSQLLLTWVMPPLSCAPVSTTDNPPALVSAVVYVPR